MPKYLKCEFTSFVKLLFMLFGIYLILTFFKLDPFVAKVAFGGVIAIYAVFFIIRFFRMLSDPHYNDYPCDAPDSDDFFLWAWLR